MTTSQITVPTAAPPRWANRLVAMLLRTPGLQNLLGRSLMLLTFTGRRTGHRYTTPVSYARSGDHVFTVTKLTRHWWRNFATHPEVVVRLAGKNHHGTAVASVGDEHRFDQLFTYLAERPMDAKAYGVQIIDGVPEEDDVLALLPQVVLIDIRLGA